MSASSLVATIVEKFVPPLPGFHTFVSTMSRYPLPQITTEAPSATILRSARQMCVLVCHGNDL
jgi:hypothetical protein